MLGWGSAEQNHGSETTFKKFEPFHEAVLGSTELTQRRANPNEIQKEDAYKAWIAEFGEARELIIMETVEANVEHYEYLRQYALEA